MNRIKRKALVGGVLTLLVAVFCCYPSKGYSEQKTGSQKRVLFNQLLDGKVIAVSSRWKNAFPLRTVSFPDLATATETEIRPALLAQGVTHLLLTSQDVYPHLSIYSDSVSLVETDQGHITFRYASRRPLSQTAMLKGADNYLSGIYLAVDKTPIHLENKVREKIKITGVVCEFLSTDDILRLPPKEVYFKGCQFLMGEKTCPYTVVIDRTGDTPFEWIPICIQPALRNSLAIEFYVLDEPSEFFTLVYTFRIKDEHIKIWKLKQ